MFPQGKKERDSFSNKQKVALLERVDQKARMANSCIVQVMASLSASWDVVIIAKMNGLIVADIRPLAH